MLLAGSTRLLPREPLDESRETLEQVNALGLSLVEFLKMIFIILEIMPMLLAINSTSLVHLQLDCLFNRLVVGVGLLKQTITV